MYTLFSLNDLLNRYCDDRVSEMLSEFRCSRDSDREHYLHHQAIIMEKKAMSRTYLALEGSHILGYFSVGMKCMQIPSDASLSNSLRKRLNINPETNIAQMYLLGQLARDDVSVQGIGVKLLEDALDIIHEAYVAVGCRAVRVDCADDLMDYYTHHGFTYINCVDGLNRLVTVLN